MSPSDEIRLGCRRILLRGLTLPRAIGAYERERGRLQKVAFEADVWVRRPENAREDVLDDVLNYDLIVEAIRNEAARGHVDLQETLVERIARHLAALPAVELVRVQSTKLEAYPDARIGVETWRRGDAARLR